MVFVESRLEWGDYLAVALYFASVISVGLWVSWLSRHTVVICTVVCDWITFQAAKISRSRNLKGYFLASRSMHWIPVSSTQGYT